MANITPDELEKKRQEVEKLRGQVAGEESKRDAHVVQTSLNIEAADLDAEDARLRAQLETARAIASSSAIKEGAADLLSTVKEEQAAAEARLKAATANREES